MAVTVLLLAASFLSWYFVPPDTYDSRISMNFFTVLFALLAVVALVRMQSFLRKVNRRWAGHWVLIVVGFLLWLIAEMIWAYFDLTLPEGLTGISFADVFWLIGYLFLIAGFVKANLDTRIVFKWRDTAIASAFAAFAFIVAFFVLLPLLSAPVPVEEKFFNLAYPVCDIVLIALILRLAMAFTGSPLGIAWSVFFLGFVVYAIADSWFAYLFITDTYYSGHLVDFLYLIDYILIFAGALLFETMSRSGLEKIREEEKKPGEKKPEEKIELPKPAAGKEGETAVEKAYGQLRERLRRKRLEEAVSIVTAMNSVDVDLSVMKLLSKTNSGMGGVFVCLDRPPAYFLEEFKEFGIDEKLIHFVAIGKSEGEEENVSFIDGPGDLTSIKLALGKAVRKMGEKYGKAFILVDCIPTLSLYHDMNTLGRFLHDLSLDLRKAHAYQVLLLAPEGEINTFVLRFCDTNISLA